MNTAAASNEPSFHVTLHYTDALLHRAVVSYLWSEMRIFYPVLLVLSLTSIGLSYFNDGAVDYWQYALLAAVCVLPIMLYFLHMLQKREALRLMQDGTGFVTISPQHLKLSSRAGESTMPWARITKLRKHKNIWLVFMGRNQFFLLPLAGFPLDAQQAMQDHIRTAGGMVR